MRRLKLVIADDHQLMIHAIRLALEDCDDIEIVGAIFQPLGVPERAEGADGAELSKRELTILQALQSGQSNKQIARELFLAEQTVKFHLTNIYRKLGVSSRTEAVRYAFEHGLAERIAYEVA